jgi:hypothetical protein
MIPASCCSKFLALILLPKGLLLRGSHLLYLGEGYYVTVHDSSDTVDDLRIRRPHHYGNKQGKRPSVTTKKLKKHALSGESG